MLVNFIFVEENKPVYGEFEFINGKNDLHNIE
jgi:hypothetical protein